MYQCTNSEKFIHTLNLPRFRKETKITGKVTGVTGGGRRICIRLREEIPDELNRFALFPLTKTVQNL
jgi:hypothetical protein